MHPIPLNLQEALRLIEDLSSAYITINVSYLGRRSMPGGRLKKLFPVKFIFSRDNRLPKSDNIVPSDNPQYSQRSNFLSEIKPEKEAGRNT
jgi:hypothetical protein